MEMNYTPTSRVPLKDDWSIHSSTQSWAPAPNRHHEEKPRLGILSTTSQAVYPRRRTIEHPIRAWYRPGTQSISVPGSDR
jgi:hypothetical protein